MDLIWVAGALLLSTAIVALTYALRPTSSAPVHRNAAEPAAVSPAPTPPPQPQPQPETFGHGPNHPRVTLSATAIIVELPGFGFAQSWRQLHALPWSSVTSLYLDTATYDSAVALYAEGPGDHRRHLVDAGALSRAQWHTMARRVTDITEGRVRLDVTALDKDRPYERF
ncbi:hypothetical protein Aab01nite_06280 [Paractinoplanes abujensis]|uniref:Uncharacterized protein n=1 Tax=Paractinoplanes abujensis TaxID=882441 RepID=A0A7W7CMY7_9ACTN|nr:hypothetical protein [Actinoplanes abujensis]MBB4691544.1 hypothetical protein [Actinoplanes abujensis]GID17038.1 hypothetical protein Aab01nite_06280 [Actinoplanes abujensis]